ncbi:DUF4157 domain-containing protein [Streptomyces rubradiris]|uniref:eCIS core domain-containing protein n=1 Tax=Streptomyces rubradiris TaxID=285531 RepID=UPI0036E943CB
MHDHENAEITGAKKNRAASRTPEPVSPAESRGFLGLQATVGNSAVVQMLRRSGLPSAPPGEHRHSADCEHGTEQPAVQRSAVHDVLRTSGQPLDGATRSDMEARLGADFSDVRIHADAAAKASAAEVGARAYTSGNHVVLGEGGRDKHTLAHELTHVIQQRRGPVAGTDTGDGLRVSDPSDRFEREAEANARRVMSAGVPVREDESRDAVGASAGGTPSATVAVQGAWWDAQEETLKDDPPPAGYRPVKTAQESSKDAASVGYQQYVPRKPAPAGITAPSAALAAGDEVHSEVDVTTRMLNRMSRVMMGAKYDEPGSMSLAAVGSPHLALTLIDGQVHIAGNTGMKAGKRTAAANRLSEQAIRGSDGHDERKLTSLLDGGYANEHADHADDLRAIAEAVRDPERLQWANTANKAPGGGKIHGEMALLDRVKTAMEAKPHPDPEGLKDWPIGGRKRDCIACHWAHAVFNRFIAEPNGYRIATAGSHGGFFPGWEMPQWMKDHAAAKAEMTRLVKANGFDLQSNGLVLSGMQEKGNTSELNPRHRTDEPYLSDSSVDEGF